MAISTFKVFLMKKGASASAYEKLIDIKNYPDLGGSPEMLETTTLSDFMQTYIEGIQKLDALEFDANYTPTEFEKIKNLKGQNLDLSVWFGGEDGANGVPTPTGAYGKFNFKGSVSAFVAGGGVNEVVGMKASVAPSTPIVYEAGASSNS